MELSHKEEYMELHVFSDEMKFQNGPLHEKSVFLPKHTL